MEEFFKDRVNLNHTYPTIQILHQALAVFQIS
ncbi:Uncharacterised protein [Mycobacteroides abscessus]|nr:Uncharacterised protein [Mycobacteroides abscessus]